MSTAKQILEEIGTPLVTERFYIPGQGNNMIYVFIHPTNGGKYSIAWATLREGSRTEPSRVAKFGTLLGSPYLTGCFDSVDEALKTGISEIKSSFTKTRGT